MAGDWIKMEHATPDKPEVIAIAKLTGRSAADVFLALFRVWCWADAQTTDGVVRFLSASCPDEIGNLSGLGAAMCQVGWLKEDTENHKIVFPNFGNHMGASAKRRAQEQKRKKSTRTVRPQSVRKVSASKADKLRTREEKRREDSIPLEYSPSPLKTKPPTTAEFMEAWNAVEAFPKFLEWNEPRLKQFRARIKTPSWVDSWREALERASRASFCKGANDRAWIATPDWFLRPGTLTKILEGQHDDRNGQPAKDRFAGLEGM